MRKKPPFLVRPSTSQGQLTLPNQYLKELDVFKKPANWKVSLNKSRKYIKLELL